MDDDASPEVLETMEVAANIHEDDTITPDGGKLIVGQGYASNNNTYMRYQDLVDRLGPNQAGFYEGDQDRFNATPSQLLYLVWDMSGEAPNFGLKYESFKAFLDSPSTMGPKRRSDVCIHMQ